ncbi:MAG: AAA family ATPase [Chloroflexi bacterium]|nr:AAA family ATPase [Chloroflexota bacterium]
MAQNAAHVRDGLIIGKFMPPHAGHQYLIDYARARVEHLTIIIFTKSHEPIPGHLRVEWLREIAADADMLHVTDEYAVDFNRADAWEFWTRSIRQVYPAGPDLLFSSEDYGDELARRLSACHVLVDPERKQVPISSTRVRERPFECWEFISPSVRAYYAKRICILGAESTGKTTLAAALAKHYNTVWVPEYAREYLESSNRPCELSDMVPIAEGQVRSEDWLARQANRVLICDTNLLATMLWSEHYWGFMPERIRQLADARHYDLYLIADLGVPWIADGLRDSPNYREWFHARYVSELEKRGQAYVILSGTFEERMQGACHAIDRSLREPA